MRKTYLYIIMTFLAFRPFHRQKHRNDVIVRLYIKIEQTLKLKSKDNTKQTLHAKFYASMVKTSKLESGKIRPPQFWCVFKSRVKIGLMALQLGYQRVRDRPYS